MSPDEMTSQQRAALVVWWAVNGDRLTIADMAVKLGVQRRHAKDIVDQVSAVIPLCVDVYKRVQIMPRN